MPSKEVVTFWLDMGAPISLLSRVVAPSWRRRARQGSHASSSLDHVGSTGPYPVTMAGEPARDAVRLWPVGLVLLLPLVGLALLIARPEFDLHWEHHPSHFWIVLIAAAVNVVLAYVTNIAAGRYRDARLTLISL